MKSYNERLERASTRALYVVAVAAAAGRSAVERSTDKGAWLDASWGVVCE